MTPRPGVSTDSLVRASFVRERRVSGGTVVETPERRDFWFGNCLVLDRAPAPSAYAPWLERHATVFGGLGVQRRVILWEVDGPRLDPPRPDRPEVAMEVSTVLVTRWTPTALARDDVVIRRLEGSADWTQAGGLERAALAGVAESLLDFYAWRTWMVELDAGRGRAMVYGAFAGGELVAYAGCYGSRDWIRLTTPVTAPAFRRRGLFSALYARAATTARARFPGATVVVVAEADSAPEHLYRSLGFGVAGYQYALVA